MKNTTTLFIAFFSLINLFGQTYPQYHYKAPPKVVVNKAYLPKKTDVPAIQDKKTESNTNENNPPTTVKRPVAAHVSSPKPTHRNFVRENNESTNSNSGNSGNKENHFPSKGFVGIGTLSPLTPLEIKRGIGNSTKKNFLLHLSNEWAENGQNEPSMMFSNGDNSAPMSLSYWSVGARVSGDQTLNTPLTFKICHKAPGSAEEEEFFSIDSYKGKVKIGDVSSKFDGYKLFVEEGILTEKVKVAVKNSEDWYDNVLTNGYRLMPLYDLDKYINKNHHLPDIPSTEEVMRDGQDLGKMNALLLKKVEELTKYVIQLKTELDDTRKEVEGLKQK